MRSAPACRCRALRRIFNRLRRRSSTSFTSTGSARRSTSTASPATTFRAGSCAGPRARLRARVPGAPCRLAAPASVSTSTMQYPPGSARQSCNAFEAWSARRARGQQPAGKREEPLFFGVAQTFVMSDETADAAVTWPFVSRRRRPEHAGNRLPSFLASASRRPAFAAQHVLHGAVGKLQCFGR